MNILEIYQQFTPTVAVYETYMEEGYLTSGFAAEAGEVMDVYAKYYRGDYDEDLLKEKLSKELGDVMWFISQICNMEGLSLEGIILQNMDKLKSRKDREVLKGSGDDR